MRICGAAILAAQMQLVGHGQSVSADLPCAQRASDVDRRNRPLIARLDLRKLIGNVICSERGEKL